MANISIPTVRVVQPIGEYFVGSIDSRKLLDISYTEIRQFKDGTQRSIAGIQRERIPSKERELAQYVNLGYATFPTSVVLSIDADMVEIDEVEGCEGLVRLVISELGSPEDEGYKPLSTAAFIIDGQHRLAGLENLELGREFNVNVAIFIGADDADKAELFGRVNQSQSKANRSLIYDLFSLAKHKSPYKMGHEVALSLNEDIDGPFHQRIKRLGKADPGMGHKQTLAQATVVDPIVGYISPDPEAERNRAFLGSTKPSRKPNAWDRYIFQPFYDGDDANGIFAIMTNYFNAVEREWGDAWTTSEKGMILNRTTGYNALMRFLGQIYPTVAGPGDVPKTEVFYEILHRAGVKRSDLNAETYVPGSSGASRLYNDLLRGAGI